MIDYKQTTDRRTHNPATIGAKVKRKQQKQNVCFINFALVFYADADRSASMRETAPTLRTGYAIVYENRIRNGNGNRTGNGNEHEIDEQMDTYLASARLAVTLSKHRVTSTEPN